MRHICFFKEFYLQQIDLPFCFALLEYPWNKNKSFQRSKKSGAWEQKINKQVFSDLFQDWMVDEL